MPNHTYRRRLINKNNYGLNINSNMNYYIERPQEICTSGETSDANILEFEKYICDIIKNISTEMNMNTIRTKAEYIINKISSKKDIYDTLDLIEEYMMSLVENISSGIDLNIIQCRIEYIRNIIKDLPCEYDTYGEFAPMLLQLLNTLTGNLDMKSFITKMSTFKNNMNDDILIIEQIGLIEETILSIISNIKDGVDFNIICNRVLYLQGLINNIKC